MDKRGYLPDFFEVYTSAETKANVLSFAEVEDRYRITYVPKEAFIVHLEDRDITFQRRGKLYVAKWEDVRGLYNTVHEMESLYTKAEVTRARVAYDLLKNAGYPSLDEFIHLVEDGNIQELLGVSRSDIRRAFEIYGLPVEYVRGKMTRKTVSRTKLQEELKAENKDQVLYSNVMVIDSQKFLLTVCEPLQLTLQTPVERETVHALGTALQGQLSTLRERGFAPTVVHVDPQSAFQGLRTQFPGIVIDVGGARDFIAKVDAKIRRVKELYRSVKAGLAWSLPVSRVKDLVAYAVSRINLRRTSALHGTLSPCVLFTGCKLSYKKELSLAFGDYIEVHASMTNTSKERSVPCIALYPCANASGMWNFWSLSSKQYLRRSVWTKMVTNDLVIRTLNGLAEQEKAEGQQPAIVEELEQEAPPAGEGQPEQPNEGEEKGEDADDVPKLEPQGEEDDSDDEAEEEEDTGQPLRRSARQAAGVKAPERYLHATKVSSKEWKEEQTKTVIVGEVVQLFQDLEALKPVYKKDVPEDAEVLTSHMFVVDKFTANGDYDKKKAQMVSHGNKQNAELHPNKSSPTAAIHSLFTVLALYAGKTNYQMGKVDIKGAFVQTPMTGPPIYMKISKNVVKYVVEVFHEYAKYVMQEGILYTKMMKAMYGCVQASRLWYEHLTGVLKEAGYKAAGMDECVWRRVDGKEMHVIVVYVDDLLIFASKKEMAAIKELFLKKFQWITMELTDKVSYLGMQINRWDNQVEVGMEFFIRKLLEPYEILPVRQTPGTRTVYQVDMQSEKLKESERRVFHTETAKLLF